MLFLQCGVLGAAATNKRICLCECSQALLAATTPHNICCFVKKKKHPRKGAYKVRYLVVD